MHRRRPKPFRYKLYIRVYMIHELYLSSSSKQLYSNVTTENVVTIYTYDYFEIFMRAPCRQSKRMMDRCI